MLEGVMSKMIGRRYGSMVVVMRVSSLQNKVLCRCDCGKEIEVFAPNLIQGRKTHCGCIKYQDRDETGKRYGRWMVIGRSRGSYEKWECRCDCGNEGIVTRTNLISGNSKSCGCLQKERASEGGMKNRRYSVEDSLDRKTRPNVSSWRNKVILRDGERCRICGRKDRLCVHHKDGWLEVASRRVDVDNGVTLCRTHHEDFHRQYGKGHSTVAQWEEYEMKEIGVLSIQIQTT
jgi:hypothetical protein